MAESTHLEVTGPVAVVEVGGTSRYLYSGARLPAGVTNLKHLVAVGLVSKVTRQLPPTAEEIAREQESAQQAEREAAAKAEAEARAKAEADAKAKAEQEAAAKSRGKSAQS